MSLKDPSLIDLFRPTLTVQPWEVALERPDGEPTRVLRSGRHRTRRLASYQTLATCASRSRRCRRRRC